VSSSAPLAPETAKLLSFSKLVAHYRDFMLEDVARGGMQLVQ
jgi:hypothetical protein